MNDTGLDLIDQVPVIMNVHYLDLMYDLFYERHYLDLIMTFL